MEDIIKRVPPNDAHAEQSAIGAMLVDNEAIAMALEVTSPEDFYQPDLRKLFDIMLELYNRGKPVDLVTVISKLKDEEALEKVGGEDYLKRLAFSVPTSAHIKDYCQIVKDKAVMRRLIKACDEINASAYDGRNLPEEVLQKAEEDIFNVVQNRKTKEFSSMSEIVKPLLEKIEDLHLNRGTVSGIPTGFYDLDYKTEGMHPSDLVLIAARPSMGKTAFALNLAQNAAVKSNITVAIFSLEMSKDQLVTRMVCSQALVDAQKVRSGNLADEDWSKLLEGVNILSQAPIYIDDTPGISIAELKAKCRKLKLEKNLGLIMIDYLQLMSGGKKSESRQQEISEISRSLKGLAREMNAPVIALSQLSRAAEQRTDHRPMLSDLRESGAIEQDADICMFLYRDEYYNKETEEPGVAEVIIAKQRNGPTGTVKLVWMGQYTKFGNRERTQSQSYD